MKFQVEQAVEILSNTPSVLKSLLENLSDKWIEKSENSEDWSSFDIVGHYIHGEETDWIPRAEIILKQGENVTFEPFDRFAQMENSKSETLNELLENFADLRQKNLEILKSWNLSGEQLQLKGIHPKLGLVSLEQLLST